MILMMRLMRARDFRAELAAARCADASALLCRAERAFARLRALLISPFFLIAAQRR